MENRLAAGSSVPCSTVARLDDRSGWRFRESYALKSTVTTTPPDECWEQASKTPMSKEEVKEQITL